MASGAFRIALSVVFIHAGWFMRRWRDFKSFEPFLSRIENLDRSQIEECVFQIPEEWCGPDPDQLTRACGKIV